MEKLTIIFFIILLLMFGYGTYNSLREYVYEQSKENFGKLTVLTIVTTFILISFINLFL